MNSEFSAEEEEKWAMLCHLSSLSGYLIPFGNIIGPMIIYAIFKDRYPFVDDQGREVINFQISMTLYMIGAAILIFILIGLPLLFILMIINFIYTVIGARQAYQGNVYRYPLNLRLV